MDLWVQPCTSEEGVHLVYLRRGYILGTSGGHGRRRSSWQIPRSVDGGQVEQKQHHAKRILGDRCAKKRHWSGFVHRLCQCLPGRRP